MKWLNIDLQSLTLTTIPQKTGLSSYLVSELKRYKELAGDAKEHLFYDGEVNHTAGMRFSRRFVRLFKEMGMAGISFHSLRHTNATKLTEVIQDVSIASKLLGHSDVTTTMTYIHKDLNSGKEAVEKFTKHVLALKEYEPHSTCKTA